MATNIPDTQPHFSPTLEANGFVFVSGQFGMDAAGRIEGDVAEQTTRCLGVVESLLAARGLTRRDIVKTTVWLRRDNEFPIYNAAYAAFFGEHRPARSTLICALAKPEALVEIEAIALARPASTPG